MLCTQSHRETKFSKVCCLKMDLIFVSERGEEVTSRAQQSAPERNHKHEFRSVKILEY